MGNTDSGLDEYGYNRKLVAEVAEVVGVPADALATALAAAPGFLSQVFGVRSNRPEPSAECLRRLAYHPVAGYEQRDLYQQNRERFIDLYAWAEKTYASDGGSRELSLALTNLQQALMWLNAHVACNHIGAEPVRTPETPS